jgi:hypothetical protein
MPEPDLSEIHVGVVVPSSKPAAWIADAVRQLAATGAKVSVEAQSVSVPAVPGTWGRLLCIAGRDANVADPDIAQSLEGLDGIEWADTDGDHPCDVDALFCIGVLAGTTPRGVIRLGVWQLVVDAASVGLRETVADEGAVALCLRRVDGDGELRPTWSRVQRLSPATSRARALWRAATLPARGLRDLVLGTTPAAYGPATDGFHEGAHLQATTAIGGSARLVGRGVATGARRVLARNEWFVATSMDEPGMLPDLGGMTPIQAPRDRFWADPFPVVDGERACIFVEEWPYALGRGILAALEIERNGDWRRLGTVLEQPWHLSHPFLFRWQGEMWMMPESSAAATLELYRCVEYPLHWQRECVVMQDVPVVDATLHEGEDHWWLFANVGGDRISTHEELHLFFADSPLGPWTPHPSNPIVSDPRSARPAGRLFEHEGQWFRPAQDCSVRYGRALVIQQILELSTERYAEQPLTHLQPEALAGANRMHTLNRDGWLTVVDGHRDRWWPR